MVNGDSQLPEGFDKKQVEITQNHPFQWETAGFGKVLPYGSSRPQLITETTMQRFKVQYRRGILSIVFREGASQAASQVNAPPVGHPRVRLPAG